MGKVLCIDTEPETEAAIRAAGHTVSSVEMGYRTGRRNFHAPPHEYDLIVCDLKKPACFDSTHWGPGKNDNLHCTLVKELSNAGRVQSDKLIMNHQLIQETQLPRVIAGTFAPTDVFRAISQAGVPCLAFINFEWARRVAHAFPNCFSMRWDFNRTTSVKFIADRVVSSTIPELLTPIGIKTPIQIAIASGPRLPAEFRAKTVAQPLVTNAVEYVFGQLI